MHRYIEALANVTDPDSHINFVMRGLGRPLMVETLTSLVGVPDVKTAVTVEKAFYLAAYPANTLALSTPEELDMKTKAEALVDCFKTGTDPLSSLLAYLASASAMSRSSGKTMRAVLTAMTTTLNTLARGAAGVVGRDAVLDAVRNELAGWSLRATACDTTVDVLVEEALQGV